MSITLTPEELQALITKSVRIAFEQQPQKPVRVIKEKVVKVKEPKPVKPPKFVEKKVIHLVRCDACDRQYSFNSIHGHKNTKLHLGNVAFKEEAKRIALEKERGALEIEQAFPNDITIWDIYSWENQVRLREEQERDSKIKNEKKLLEQKIKQQNMDKFNQQALKEFNEKNGIKPVDEIIVEIVKPVVKAVVKPVVKKPIVKKEPVEIEFEDEEYNEEFIIQQAQRDLIKKLEKEMGIIKE